MNDRATKLLVAAGAAIGALSLARVALTMPGYLTDIRLLGAVIFLEFLVLMLWNYRSRFFLALMVAFLWAGTAVPLKGIWIMGRWPMLAAGAIAGLFVYLREHNHHFGVYHLVAFGCVMSAFVSAMVSSYPRVAFLKAASLLLLFLYAATGARLAVVGREAVFLSGLLLVAELLVYATAFCYGVLRVQVFGNPNSLGVGMGVMAFPILLWGVFVSDRPSLKRRRTIALLLCLLLLLSSYARAGMVAAGVSWTLLCFGLRRYRTFVGGLAAVILAAFLVMTFVPIQNSHDPNDTSIAGRFLYKGKRDVGVLGTRTPVWDRTLQSLEEHPWFGTGFGTSDTDAEESGSSVALGYAAQGVREHGTSYLAITEWVGLLGVTPFLFLLMLVVRNVVTVMTWLRRTASPFSPAVPFALFVAGALVHASFEDWMFAVGYYACVFFWSFAFVLPDLLPAAVPRGVYSTLIGAPATWQNNLNIRSAGR